MRQVKVSQKFAFVDDEDFDLISQRKWYIDAKSHSDYAITWIYIDGRKTTISMHRFLMKPPEGLFIDHIDGNGLNNQKSNLRFVNRSQNALNSGRWNNRSGYKGVVWVSHKRMWAVQIKLKKLGYFKDKIEAAKAYDKIAKEYFGEFARLNFPERGDAITK